ncbi:transglutaminase-like domain-containing protein [Arvimicrobium flavum]|uniref:transglutaminase-like domain-containing protein n=1 Tax=Arvimicrobium flavum TaxID=3393320 RepID=UPI00237BF87B|nr:transglutaminase family protein [Mesorhizobium shangrilense]
MEVSLRPTQFIDFDSPAVRDFAHDVAGMGPTREKAVRLNLAVRDRVRYDPYSFNLDPDHYRASRCLAAGAGFCVHKAILLAACARAVGISARLGYANVRNHLTSPRLSALMESDVFRWHGYVSLHLGGSWVKATPAFDLGLCRKFGVTPLEFDGAHDSVFHPYDSAGRRHMEYLEQIGEFDDFPQDLFFADMRQHYPKMIAMMEGRPGSPLREADRAFETGE